MYTSVEQFFAQHYAAISDLLADAATRAGGHYAEMSAETRRLTDDLLRLTNTFEPRFEDYFTHDLRDQPYLVAALHQRLRQVNTNFRANLLSAKIDQALSHPPPPPGKDSS